LCGTGGNVCAIHKVYWKANQGKEFQFTGKKTLPTTYKLAKMNLAIRGFRANLGDKHAELISNDQHKDLKLFYEWLIHLLI